MASRNLLHKNKLEEFKRWLLDNEILYRPGKGDWAIIQIHWKGAFHKLYARGNMSEHVTVQDALVPLVQKFIHGEDPHGKSSKEERTRTSNRTVN